MTLPHILSAYLAEFQVLDRALAGGCRIPYPDRPAALHFRHRLNKARVLRRRQSTEIYSPGDPGYNSCEYDLLVVRVVAEDGRWWVRIERNVPPEGIESLGQEEIDLPEPSLEG